MLARTNRRVILVRASTAPTWLDALVAPLRADGHQVLILELPLYPFQNAFGAALLPKRCFTQVLGTPNGTLDGVHLSQVGHDAMANVIAGVLRTK